MSGRYIDQFRSAMVQRGLVPPDEIHADGRIHRCDVDGKGGKGDGAYLLHGDGVPAGGLQNHRDGLGWETWRADLGRSLTPAEDAEHRARVESQRAQREADEERQHEAVALEAFMIMKKAKSGAPDHPYVRRKGIRPYGARINGKNLVIPMRDTKGKLWGVQTIDPEGNKRFQAGARKRGCYFALGKPGGTIVIVEGFATGCSIHQATDLPVAVAFDCGNLVAVARALREKLPEVRIIIAADNDTGTNGNPGLTKATEAAAAVGGIVAVPATDTEVAGDFNDLHAEHGIDAVRAVFDAAQAKLLTQVAQTPKDKNMSKLSNMATEVLLVKGSDLKPEPIRWAWPGWLARGKFHVLGGPPGSGKTTLAMGICSTFSRGGRWPDGSRCEAGNVLIWSGEDDPSDTLLPRLLAAGADPARIFFVSGTRINGESTSFDPARDMLQLSAQADDIGDVSLLVVDPVVSAISGDGHKNNDVRRGLQPLVDLASVLDCAVLGITHFTKGSGGRDPTERITGSLAFGAVARVVIVAAKTHADDGREYRLLARAKSNIGPDDGGFEYSLEQMEVPGYSDLTASVALWGAAVEGTARELLTEPEPATKDGAEGEAEEFLRDLLKDGPVPSKAVQQDAKEAGHSWATVRRASEALQVIKRKGKAEDTAWYWSLARLPEKHQVAQVAHVSVPGDDVSNLPSDVSAEAF